MIHGHEVLHMMEGNRYTEESLVKAINDRFGTEERFYTCSAENMTAVELVEFLKDRGKFMPADTGFTVYTSTICNH